MGCSKACVGPLRGPKECWVIWARNRPAAAPARLGVKFLGEGVALLTSMFGNHWHDFLIERLRLRDGVREKAWRTRSSGRDGKGEPAGVKGEGLTTSSRLVNLADVVEVFHAKGVVAAAIEVARGPQRDAVRPAPR